MQHFLFFKNYLRDKLAASSKTDGELSMSFNFPLGLIKYIVIVNLNNTEFVYNSFNRNFICDGILFVSRYKRNMTRYNM